MDSNIDIRRAESLSKFCETVVAKHSENWPPKEETVAEEFLLSFFQSDGVFLNVPKLGNLCAALGISVSIQELPKGLRGHNFAFQETRRILIASRESTPAVFGIHEHTLFHELRELIEYEFWKIGRPVATDSDRESRAEMFAMLVRSGASVKAWKPLFEGASEIERKWIRVAAISILVAVTAVHAFSCIMLPHWEEHLESPLGKRRRVKHRS